MKLTDLINFSIQSFKNRKSRMILTVLGMAVAIGVILFLVSLGYGLQKTILERITTEDSLLTLDVYPPETESIKLDSTQIQSIGQLPDVTVVSPQAVVSAPISFNSLTSETAVNVVDPNFFKLAGIEADKGELLSEKESNTIVVSPILGNLFDVAPDELVNKTVTLTFTNTPTENQTTDNVTADQTSSGSASFTQDFKIVGVTASDDNNQVYVKSADVKSLRIDEYQFVKVQVKDQSKIEAVRQALIDKGFLVSALSDVVSQANQIFSIIQIILAVFGIFSLFVAAIGLINTMTISLLERINEIGIMRAIGASSWDIKKIFLIESTLIGFFGGIVGIVFGFIGGLLFNLGLNLLARALGGQPISIFHTPLWFMFFIITFSALVGFASGVVPAQKAGKLNALSALRYK